MDKDSVALLVQLGWHSIDQSEVIQSLWGGYGELVRVSNGESSLIVKHIRLPEKNDHPRGWNTARSHNRKLRSYQVEASWYRDFAAACSSECVVPKPIFVGEIEGELTLVMEDLKQLGFPNTLGNADPEHVDPVYIRPCLKWLAHFHAQHISHHGEGLWESGTYWHLQTRPDELAKLRDLPLKQAAEQIDDLLNQAPYQTLVHGDAKLANFCFSDARIGESEQTSDGEQIKAAAVDFQYVGRGCAMKDVALFISSAVPYEKCFERESELLDIYFSYLNDALAMYQPHLDSELVIASWRPLFCVAWADFQRFVKGWSPEHWKINPYTESLKERALEQIKQER
ncbi:phosphotransferase [Vibrio sp. SCSIO 43135]|uniref:ecdysteroid 22-kinase family protein n=1 Tax=Vibrio sp. SCSIO 43135 TaxID=2819096 RepID=UPI0020761007|nr:ecdysteroid 22-kinase family protein [Vibrio sp. SCSIO 43135]USD43490.1 phosphotransferase [Vibrio sp. SCSIO 43135]